MLNIPTTRILTALALLAPFLAALFFLPGRYWAILVLGVTVLASLEWSRICGFSRGLAFAYAMLTAFLGALLVIWPESVEARGWLAASGLFWVLVAPLWLAGRWQPKNPLVLATVGWIILAPTALALVVLREAGPLAVLAVLVLIWIADTAAYFSGRAYGRRKLAPAISPGKTWEGVIGAFAAVTLYGAAVSHFGALSLWIVPGFWALTVLSILGDLFESWMKRQAGLKDSGSLLPGHGGILDRIDSLTSTLPIAAWLLPFVMVFLTSS